MKDPRLMPDGLVKNALPITSILILLAIFAGIIIANLKGDGVQPAQTNTTASTTTPVVIEYITKVVEIMPAPTTNSLVQWVLVERTDLPTHHIRTVAGSTQTLKVGDYVVIELAKTPNEYALAHNLQESFNVSRKIE